MALAPETKTDTPFPVPAHVRIAPRVLLHPLLGSPDMMPYKFYLTNRRPSYTPRNSPGVSLPILTPPELTLPETFVREPV